MMKTSERMWVALLVPACLLLMGAGSSKPRWVLRMETSSNTCHVQAADEAPLSNNLVSSHETRKQACQAAKDKWDSESSDQKGCWGYGPGTINTCKKEGIALPGGK